MKKTNLLKSVLLLCALVAGSGSVWAKNSVSTVNTKFTAAGNVSEKFTQTGDFKNVVWNLDVTWSSEAYWGDKNSTKGNQIGSGSKPATKIVLKGSSVPGAISSVVVNTSGASGITGTVGIKVGNVNFKNSGNTTVDFTKDATDYEFTGTASGDIVITWNQTSSKAIYIKSITVTYDDTKYAISTGKEYTTYVTPAKLDFTGHEKLKAYIATSATSSAVTMVAVNKVAKDVPLVLKSTDTANPIEVPVTTDDPDDVSANKLVASDGVLSIGGSGVWDYILSNGLFYHASSGVLPAGKCYLHLTEEPAANELTMDFDDEESGVTGIKAIDNEQLTIDNVAYNLAGQRVDANHKGIVVVNGKKYVNK